jgi:hypothetical protein
MTHFSNTSQNRIQGRKQPKTNQRLNNSSKSPKPKNKINTKAPNCNDN